MVTTHFRALVTAIPRTPTAIEVTTALGEMETLREEIVNQLEMQLKTKNISGNPFQNDRHIQTSNPESNSELEPANEQKQGENSEPGKMTPKTAMTRQRRDRDGKPNSPTVTTGEGGQSSPSVTGKMKAFPLVLEVRFQAGAT